MLQVPGGAGILSVFRSKERIVPKKNAAPDYSDVEMRRSTRTSRRMSVGRRITYTIGKQLLRFVLFVLTSSYRFEKVLGGDIADRLIANKDQVCVPVLWHAQQIVITHMIRGWIDRGFKAGYIISASVDGEVPADIAKSWGAEVIRGSAQETGTLVLRDAIQLMKRGVSIVTSPDGPLGPPFEIKTGTVIMARIAGAPILPIVCAASSAWTMNTWDHFMIPKPFARVVVAVGEPVEVPRGLPMSEIESVRKRVQLAMESLAKEARQHLS
jgi:lysophospholipid acyltransferase (LPLAT)-like uncharacterized protein